jgi:DNA-binding response OmpR family regulator
MGNNKRRLLCVEDHRDTCELITSALKDFEVVSVTNVADARARARQGGFDLIVVDYYLPDGTGEQLCKDIRDFDQRTPILFVTGTDDFSETQSRSIGGQGMIKKGRANFVTELRARAAELS